MQIILLSGGSGKRLWPLSNGTRSKQFLRVLKSPSGESESMVQRVMRQIGEAGLEAEVTIATSETQREAITNQLGGGVAVVTEPERRDTFPAIALSAGWLALEMGCSRDEVVVVMPCDPYTEVRYFETVGRMVEAVEADAAELVLMGVEPTAPSTKFGYVVPQSGEQGLSVQRVQRFTEKPSRERAEELLREGAFWNGGVFAFRLGYMVDIIERYIHAADFAELRSRYGEFPKISFDYEVAEKAHSVAVVPYAGAWKDLGTWNSLAEELPENCMGNGHIDAKCENTHVVNELELPILCVGVKDVIVAASPDGILVCDKSASEGMKSEVEKFDGRPMYEERRWGTYRVLGQTVYPDGHHSLTKLLHLNAGCSISYQTHARREEVWTFVDGEGLLALEGKVTRVGRGDVAHIRRGEHHAVKALTDLEIIEVQSGDELVEEDIKRYPFEFPERL